MNRTQDIPVQEHPRHRNKLLARLPDGERIAIEPHLEALALDKDYCIAAVDTEISHVYFLDEGIGSMVVVSPEGHRAEAGMFGSEGFAPVPPAVLSSLSLHEVVIQSAGSGRRMSVQALWGLASSCPSLMSLMTRASHNLATQVSFTALSNAVHQVDERLARWLLMAHDRVETNEIYITHEYISLMLAVRRPSVTTALHILEGNQMIRSERGVITIRDRPALEEFARDAYGKPEAEYRHLFGQG
ncbi:Crp/Fnr family transcriptional regulator [Rhizobium glycinendophyticum]|uniref:Crp/Fnr family transcriptional regulator n=1 Tax=Rhizobium glycinendophyticum TaxID=2589807 RepID=A0A504UAX9_9HYPH|nr:Crp/Fnr family transcriptional regulator [Rhizobium glycinendophyticum]